MAGLLGDFGVPEQGTDMERVHAVYRKDDFPGTPDAATAKDLEDLFGYLFPQVENPEIDRSHSGIAIAARNPRLALSLAKLSGLIAGELPWSKRRDLRELAIQTVNLHFKCDYSFRARKAAAAMAGIGAELQDALPQWRTSGLYNDEQRLVIAYALAVVAGDVPDELFSRVAAQFGETGAIEFTTVVAFWSFWAMFLNATGPGLTPAD
jgi:alkylhydroperoxidase family enzyme